MAGITIVDVKVVGECSKHNNGNPMKDKYGRIYRDDEIECIICQF